VPPERTGGSGERYLPGEVVQDNSHAEGLAQAELDRRASAEVTVRGVADGDLRLAPGALVQIEAVADSLSGRYVVSAVNHSIDHRKGFVSEFSTVPPPPRERTPGAIAALGTVVSVADPDRLGRVRVSLPSYGDVETEWLHVLAAAAGGDKGLTMVPDVGDRVLVLFPCQAPGYGVVLGGLYGMAGPVDSGVEGDAVLRYTLLTRGGQRVQLDDAKHTLRLDDSTGNYIELSPDKVLLHAEVDLELEAPGRTVVVRGEAIDFRRG
jgi:phage baseplate assembly protein gpV